MTNPRTLAEQLRHAHNETLQVFKHLDGDVSPREAAKQAADYMLEVLLLTAVEEEPRPCSNCGCEERDHRGILTCRCPDAPSWPHQADEIGRQWRGLLVEADSMLSAAGYGRAVTKDEMIALSARIRKAYEASPSPAPAQE